MNDNQDESIEAQRRQWEDEYERRKYMERLSYRDSPNNQFINDGSGIAGKVIAGVFIAVISFLSAEMYDFHNQLISIEQKMKLLVTSDFKIVPDSKHIEHELAREVLDGRLIAIEKELLRITTAFAATANLGAELREAHRMECLKHLELLRGEAGILRREITDDFRRADEYLGERIFKKTEEIDQDLDKLSKRLQEAHMLGMERNKGGKGYW